MVACAEEVRRRIEDQRTLKARAEARAKERGAKAAAAVEEEEDSDGEAFAVPSVSAIAGAAVTGVTAAKMQFVWDPVKGALVEKPAAAPARGSTKKAGAPEAKVASNEAPQGTAGAKEEPQDTAPEGDAKEGVQSAKAAAEGEEQAGEEEGSDEDEESSCDGEEDQAEAESKQAFLNDASTPELIKQAIAVGGPMADGIRDKWVLDRATDLYFRYDTAVRSMHCWNGEQGCMYLWKERGKMDFLWVSPFGPGKLPPTSSPSAPPTPAGEQPPQPEAAAAAAPAPAPVEASAEEAAARAAAGGADGQVAEGQAGQPLQQPLEQVQEPQQQQQPQQQQRGAVAAGEEPQDGQRLSLQVTVIPPEVLIVGGVDGANLPCVEEVEMSVKAMAGVIGKGGASIQEIEKRSGVKASTLESKEGEHTKRLQLQGTKAQVQDAKQMLEQKVVLVIGEKAAEKMRKHINGKILEGKRTESGADAAKGGVNGLSEFCKKWAVKAVMARKLAKMDAMLQRYMIRHFNPTKAKAANLIKGYTAALMKQPQKWRLEALYEDGELDGEVCETSAVGESGAMVGRQRPVDGETEGAGATGPGGEQLIELEVDEKLGERAARIYGDVQPQHCRLLRMGRDFYAWAQETTIGTVVDGQKVRQHDGPVPIRDGSVVGVGKYLIYCEIGTPDALQLRRKRLLRGERLWGGAAAGPAAGAAEAAPPGEKAGAEGVGAEAAEAEAEARAEGEDEQAEGAEDEEMVAGEPSAGDMVAGSTEERSAEAEAKGSKRKEPPEDGEGSVVAAASDNAAAGDGDVTMEAAAGASSGQQGTSRNATRRRAAKLRRAAEAGGEDAASAVVGPAGSSAAPARSSAADLAASFEAEAAAARGVVSAAPVRSSAAAMAAAFESGGEQGEPQAEGGDEDEEEDEDEDPMAQMMKQLGMPAGFG